VRQRANTPGANQTIVLAGIPAVLPLIETMAAKLANPAHARQLAEATALENAARDTADETDKRLRQLDGREAAYQSGFERMVRSF